MFNPMDSLPQWHRDVIAETEAREAREWEAEQAEKRDRDDTAMRMAEHHENMVVYRTNHTSAELQEAASNTAAAAEMRNYQGEWGSAQRSAVFVTGAGGQPIQLQPRELASGPVTMRADSIPARLARAREVKRSATVLGMVADLERRERSSRKPVISRSENPGEARCIECAAENLSEAESFDVHHDPRFGDPLPPVTVPDYPPQQRSRRVRAGTGWPEISR